MQGDALRGPVAHAGELLEQLADFVEGGRHAGLEAGQLEAGGRLGHRRLVQGPRAVGGLLERGDRAGKIAERHMYVPFESESGTASPGLVWSLLPHALTNHAKAAGDAGSHVPLADPTVFAPQTLR